MLATKRVHKLKRPYPGLRSFEADEATLFHGRDCQTGELLRRLSQDRFLAVVGGSGSGKSSLVRAGLLPALYRGYLAGATSRWQVAVMRPGSAPLAELAKALAAPGALGACEESGIRESSFGLVNAVRTAGLEPGASLLLVVDQFEELFRFQRESAARDGGAEASLFVSQLLQAADSFGTAIFVVITMRSDFLGDCAQFPGLPEALNKGQYLIPRMTREQRREAITDALDLFEASMSDRLVQRLLNDTGDDPDQLPVLQHALQQTYAVWEREGRQGDIDLDHYTRAGTMEHALHDHAQSVYESTGESGWIVERIFRCLTVDENNRAVRRPAKLARILRVIGVAGDAVHEPEAVRIIKLFGAPEHSFLVWDRRPNLDPESVVDISHESLIRKWKALQEWVRQETKAVDVFRYVRRDAGLYPNEAALWGDPDLSGALRTRGAMNWNEAWAEQYSQTPGATFEQVQEFLRLSVEERERQQRRERWLTRLKWGAAMLVLALLAGAIWGYRIYRENEASKHARAEMSASLLALQSDKDNLARRSQELQRHIAEKEEILKQGVSDPKALAEIDRLKREQARTQQSLAEREKLISANNDQVQQTSQNYSESLKRINELQASLAQAWKERDQARLALEKPTGKAGPSIAEVTDLRSRLDKSEAEVARLQQQLRAAPAPAANSAARLDPTSDSPQQLRSGNAPAAPAPTPTSRAAAPVAVQPSGSLTSELSRSSRTITKVTKVMTVRATLGTVRVPRGLDLADALGENWRGRYLFVSDLSSAAPAVLTLTVLHTAKEIPPNKRDKEGFEAAARALTRVDGAKLEPESAVTCKMPAGQTCGITDVSGAMMGITAQALSPTSVELTIRVQH